MIHKIDVIEDHEATFEAAVAEATLHFKRPRGCRIFALRRSIEHPRRYRLTVGRDSVEDQIVHRDSAGFRALRGLVERHFAARPRVDHVERVIDEFLMTGTAMVIDGGWTAD